LIFKVCFWLRKTELGILVKPQGYSVTTALNEF